VKFGELGDEVHESWKRYNNDRAHLKKNSLYTGKYFVKCTKILPVVLYGCETWSFTLTEKRRLRVFENRVLRIIFGPKRDEVTGE
jgi:hypothetical protein